MCQELDRQNRVLCLKKISRIDDQEFDAIAENVRGGDVCSEKTRYLP